MSSSDDDNDFPACWKKDQCEMFKNNGWPRSFRTVLLFKIAKHRRPFTDPPQQIDLQVLNAICMGRIMLFDQTCAAFAIHGPIASEIKTVSAEKSFL